ncbi:UNVERIFIED_CONTAM: hypothetical protein RMT77_016380 [Armadillidium vulgare]
MNFGDKGIILGSEVGFLDLTPEVLENLICTDPITDHFEVEMTPFARGKFAAVRRVRCLRTGEYYAAKVVRRRRRARDSRYETIHEAAVLALAKETPEIVKLHQVFEGPAEMTLILELASGGELQRVIDEEERIEERVVKRYLRHILTALRFLHSHNIAHLDLKPQNLLLTGSHPDSDVKLCDFGISRVILADIEVKEILGTPDYVAPEILQYEPISLATDMWSVGVLVYVLLTGHSPFGGDTKQETFLNISQCQLDFPDDLFSGISSSAMEFISALLVVDPRCRLTVSEALEHPWLSPSEISLPQPRLPTLQMKEEHDITLVSLKRSSSPSKGIVSNKENNRNLLNSSISPSGSSPPSKRECRESNESEPDIESSNHSADLEVVTCIPPQSPRLPKHHHSPKIQSRTPTKDRGRVSKQIKCIEMRLKSTPPKNNLGDADESNVNGQKQSVASLKAKFTNQINLNISAMPSSRRNNLNKSFGSVDQPDGKEKVSEALRRYSPLCIRRDQNQSNSSSDQTKYGSRSDFQDMVIRNGYIC